MKYSCIADLIGIKHCESCNAATVCYYIDSLPQVSLKRSANITEYPDAIKFLNDAIALGADRAGKKLLRNIPNFEFTKVKQRNVIGYDVNTFTPIEESVEGVQGITIIPSTRCKYLKYRIKNIYVDAGIANVTVDGTVYPVVDCIAKVNQDYRKQFDITIDYGTGSTFSRKSTYRTGNCSSMYSGYDSCDGCADNNSCYSTDTVGGTKGTIHGMTILMDCRCDDELLICEYADDLAYSAILEAAILVQEEVLNSSRCTPIVAFGKKEAAQNIGYLEKKLDEEMKDVAKMINLVLQNGKDCCFKCAGTTIQTQTT